MHLSDYLRIATVFKGGGLYLDLDMLILKPLETAMFRNFLLFENHKHLIANAFFQLDQKHPIIGELVDLLRRNYRPDSYIYHGPEAFTKALRRYCNISSDLIRIDRCRNIKLMPNRVMDPFGPYLGWDIYFNEAKPQHLKRAYSSYAIHHFRSAGRNEINMTSKQFFGIMAQRNCPVTVKRIQNTK